MALPDNWRDWLRGKTIHLTFYCHSDWQWTCSRDWHRDRYTITMQEALDLLERTADFSMVIDTPNEFFDVIREKIPERLDEIKARVKEGRIGIAPCGIANGRPTQIGDETFVRNLALGKEYFRRLFPEADLSVFHSVDISIGHAQMPQVLRLAGFANYRAWRPEGPLDAKGVPRQFRWRGLDGSEVVVVRRTYGGLAGGGLLPQEGEDWDVAAARMIEHLVGDQFNERLQPTDHLISYVGMDDARPFRIGHGDEPYDLTDFLATWRQREEASIVFDTPAQLFAAVRAQQDRLPVVEGVIDPCECHYNMGWGGVNGMWWLRRQTDASLCGAETWCALASQYGETYPEEELQRLWRDHLTYQPHAAAAPVAGSFDLPAARRGGLLRARLRGTA